MHAGQPGARHVPALDGVRGVAILLVLLFHGVLPFRLVMGTHPLWLFDIGWVGVDIFFVLSGYLITGILLEEKERPRFFVNFYGRRTLRIFPLYYMVLGVVFLIGPGLTPEGHLGDPQTNQLFLWTYTSNLLTAYAGEWMFHSEFVDLNHTWSLAIEEQFYLVWPLLVRFTGRRTLARACVGIFLGSLAARLLALEAGAGLLTLYTAPVFRFDGLALGALLAALGPARQNVPLRYAVGALILGLVGVAAIALTRGPGYETGPMMTVGLSAIAVVAASLIWILTAPGCPRALRSAFERPELRFFGKYSYGIYLYHWILYPYIRSAVDAFLSQTKPSLLVNEAVSTLALVAGSTFVAFASYHLVEKRFLQLKDNFR